jgi:hypothetical protein
MRLKYLLGFLLFGTGTLLAQTPAAFKYQTVCRDASGVILANQMLGFRLSLLQGSPNGPTVFSETHSTASNDFGVVNLNVGQGNSVQGTIQNLDWINNSYFLKVEFDPSGQSNYLFMGSSQIMAVPYALNAKHAKQAERSLNDQDTSSSNEIQTLSIVGNQLQISGGNSVTFTGVVDLDPDPTNELQVLQLSNDTLFLSSGNFVVLPPDGDADSTNELQTIGLSNDTLFLSSGNFVVLPPDADADSSNELQQLSFSNDTLSISMGNSVPIPSKTPWYAAGGTLDAGADKTGNVYRPGSVGIGNNPSPDSSAILDLNSSNKGFLPPRIALQAKNIAAPVSNPTQGLLVFNTATSGNAPNQVSPGYYYWSGSEWRHLIENTTKNYFYWDYKTQNPMSNFSCMSSPFSLSNGAYLSTASHYGPPYLDSTYNLYLSNTNGNNVQQGTANINLFAFDFSRDISIHILGNFKVGSNLNGNFWFGIAGLSPWVDLNGNQLNQGLVIKSQKISPQVNITLYKTEILINNILIKEFPIDIIDIYGITIEFKTINCRKYIFCKYSPNSTNIFPPIDITNINWNPTGTYFAVGAANNNNVYNQIMRLECQYLE